MGKINVLNKEVSELIAAGEVIERPASVVKELIENSIDASADAITLEIHRGGISYIRITDNGSGIEKDDVKTAFLRHATSKVKSTDDLESIGTLGFRGEALASIAAVSKIELITKTENEQYATKIVLEGGDVVSVDETGAPKGTTILVRDLFYNVPARLKFLKKDVSEANAISSIIDKISLSHPEISFKYINEDKLRMHTPGNGDLQAAIYSVFGREFANSMIPVDYELNGVKVSGYISSTKASRANRSMQNFFVNSRYVKSKTCMVALEEGYKNAIMVGKHPSCVVNVQIKNDMVDVNVHPAKIEVRFVNEKIVFDALYFAVKNAIKIHDDVLKEEAVRDKKQETVSSVFRNTEGTQTAIKNDSENVFAVKKEVPIEQAVENKSSKNEINYNSYFTQSIKPSYMPKVSSAEVGYKYNKKGQDKDYSYIKPESFTPTCDNIIVDTTTGEVVEMPVKSDDSSDKTEINVNAGMTDISNVKQEPAIETGITVDIQGKSDINFKIIGELFKTYLLFEGGDCFYMMDKHAAHERILFEKLKNSVNTEQRQVLIKPVVVSVTPEEKQALHDSVSNIEKLGFMYEDFGNNTVILREIPLVLSDYNANDIFLNVIQNVVDNKKTLHSDAYEDLLHSIACRCAVKAHDDSSIEELTALLKLVCENDEIRHCPHGRPIVVSMKKSEIERKFGRI